MTVHSAGILVYRYKNNDLQVLLVHPGGPFWSGKVSEPEIKWANRLLSGTLTSHPSRSVNWERRKSDLRPLLRSWIKQGVKN